MEISTREKTLQIVSRYVIITLSISIMTIGVYFFKFPNNFVFGGVTGAGDSTAGYEIDGTALTITDSGTYTVSGSCADGSIKVPDVLVPYMGGVEVIR